MGRTGTLLLHCYYSASYLITLFSAQAELLVPRTLTVIRQRRAFSVAGPTASNGLKVVLRPTPVANSALFLTSLKTTFLTEVGLGALLSRLP